MLKNSQENVFLTWYKLNVYLYNCHDTYTYIRQRRPVDNSTKSFSKIRSVRYWAGDRRTVQSAAGHAPSSRCYRQTNALSRTRPHFAPLFWFFSRTQIAHFGTRSFAEFCEAFGRKELAEIGSVKLDLWLFAAGFPETRLLQLGSS
jgi:hypothetical protein